MLLIQVAPLTEIQNALDAGAVKPIYSEVM
jgi:hypothetical protein